MEKSSIIKVLIIFVWAPLESRVNLHCEKSLLVLASRQKIPLLRKENPAVKTRTIYLPPIEFFKIPHARKATARKSRPETTDTAVEGRVYFGVIQTVNS
jgi:hypothetical protein